MKGEAGSLFTSEWVHKPLIMPIVTLALLFAALIGPHEAETTLTASGGLLLIGGHLGNRFYSRQARVGELAS